MDLLKVERKPCIILPTLILRADPGFLYFRVRFCAIFWSVGGLGLGLEVWECGSVEVWEDKNSSHNWLFQGIPHNSAPVRLRHSCPLQLVEVDSLATVEGSCIIFPAVVV